MNDHGFGVNDLEDLPLPTFAVGFYVMQGDPDGRLADLVAVSGPHADRLTSTPRTSSSGRAPTSRPSSCKRRANWGLDPADIGGPPELAAGSEEEATLTG